MKICQLVLILCLFGCAPEQQQQPQPPQRAVECSQQQVIIRAVVARAAPVLNAYTMTTPVSLEVPYNLPLTTALTNAYLLGGFSQDTRATIFGGAVNQVQEHGTQLKFVCLFHYDAGATSDQVVADMDKEGWRPAILPEALAYSAADHLDDFSNPIIVLGSSYKDSVSARLTPELSMNVDGRGLNLLTWEGEGVSRLRYLAVMKN